MSAQILLQGRLLGAGEFLLASPADRDNRAFEARSTWLALVGEAIPRALLAELSLPPLMLGSSGSDRFLLILPDQARADAASEFLLRVNSALERMTAGAVRLAWAATENLGDWTIVRKRLQSGLLTASRPPASQPDFFEPLPVSGSGPDSIPRNLQETPAIHWSLDLPALIEASSETTAAFTWTVGTQGEIPLARHAAHSGDSTASVRDLGRRAHGHKLWGVLRGEIDDYATRIRRLQSVEEHVHFSTLYKQFLSGEIELLCSQGEYFQRVTVLSSGRADFAVCGSWDALAAFAMELQRVFARFAQEQLKDLPGAEARTITMALAIAEPGASLAHTYEDCGHNLAIARAADKDCLHILDRVLEWKQLNDAAELKDAIMRLHEEFRGGRQFLAQLSNLYKKVEAPERMDEDRILARAARFQRRFARVANRREREFQKLRAHLMKEVAGRRGRGPLKLRPEGLLALEWAKLAEELN
jgi:CRISPR-associated protein Csm1